MTTTRTGPGVPRRRQSARRQPTPEEQRQAMLAKRLRQQHAAEERRRQQEEAEERARAEASARRRAREQAETRRDELDQLTRIMTGAPRIR